MGLEYVWFVLVGMGTGWTSSDALWSETPVFVSVFEEGLKLPSRLAAMGQVAGLGALVVVMLVRGRWGEVSEGVQESVVWFGVVGQVVMCGILAVAWNFTWKGWPVVLFLVMASAQVVGTLNTLVVMPFVSTRCDARLVSAVSVGVQLSSMLAGLLGIIQLPREGASPAFSPHVFYSLFTVLLLASVYAWYRVSRGRIGFNDGEKLLDLDSSEESSGPLYWLWLTVLPLDMAAWGFAPSLLPFAASATTGVCDPNNAHIISVMRYAISMSFFALPLAAFATTIRPTYSRPKLAALAAVGLGCFILEASALFRLASSFWRLTFMAPLLILCHFILRFTDTYIVTIGFRIIAETYAVTADRQRHAETLGILVTMGCLVSSVTAVVLIQRGIIGC